MRVDATNLVPGDIRRFCAAQAKAQAELLAVRLARAHGVEGKRVGADPDRSGTVRLGKTPIHWIVVLEPMQHGTAFDGPLGYRVNLVTGSVAGV